MRARQNWERGGEKGKYFILQDYATLVNYDTLFFLYLNMNIFY